MLARQRSAFCWRVIDDAVAHIAGHYRAAVDPAAPPWHLGAWREGSVPGTQ